MYFFIIIFHVCYHLTKDFFFVTSNIDRKYKICVTNKHEFIEWSIYPI